jgi:hypothetical protein
VATSQRTTDTRAARSARIGYRARQDFGLLLLNRRQRIRAFAFCDSLVVFSTKSGTLSLVQHCGTRSRKGRVSFLAACSCFASIIPTLWFRLRIVRLGEI